MLVLFDKQIQLRMGQANVKHWVDDILALLGDEDVLDVEGFATPTCRCPRHLLATRCSRRRRTAR